MEGKCKLDCGYKFELTSVEQVLLLNDLVCQIRLVSVWSKLVGKSRESWMYSDDILKQADFIL